jgi:hypothetical protein
VLRGWNRNPRHPSQRQADFSKGLLRRTHANDVRDSEIEQLLCALLVVRQSQDQAIDTQARNQITRQASKSGAEHHCQIAIERCRSKQIRCVQ